jgi:hypothetical protein
MKKLFAIILVFLLISCSDKTVEDVRQVKKGISVKELKYIMGEPNDVEIYPSYEQWEFYYDGGGRSLNGFVVIIYDDKVTDFYSY